MKTGRFLFTLWLLIVAIHGADAQTDSIKPYKNNILPSPSLSYQPATDLIIGAYLLYQFKPKKAGPDTRPSNAQFWVASSFNQQNFLELSHETLTTGENWYLKGKIDARFNPEYYYGIGNDTPLEDQAIAEYKYVEVKERVLKQVKKKLFVGGQLQYTWTSPVVFKTESGDTIPPADVAGIDGNRNFGFGATVLKDERNSILTPTRNKYILLSFDYFLGDTKYFKTKLDIRKYWRIKNNDGNVIALQYLLEWAEGEVPFKEYSKLGGAKIMRGYIQGRYRNLVSTQLQAEYRRNIVGRLGFTLFGGIGNVLPSFTDLDPADMKYAVGTGLRFNINRKDPANVRIDYGVALGDNSQAVYITFGEAF